MIVEVLAERGRDACIVILCPKAIRWKWKRELRTKFGIRAEHSSFKFSTRTCSRASISFLKVLRQPRTTYVCQIRASLVIDEVPATSIRLVNKRGRAVDLSKASKAVVGFRH